jgi:hypothetical protein
MSPFLVEPRAISCYILDDFVAMKKRSVDDDDDDDDDVFVVDDVVDVMLD